MALSVLSWHLVCDDLGKPKGHSSGADLLLFSRDKSINTQSKQGSKTLIFMGDGYVPAAPACPCFEDQRPCKHVTPFVPSCWVTQNLARFVAAKSGAADIIVPRHQEHEFKERIDKIKCPW